MSKPFKKCKYAEFKQISEKAVVIKSFDGQEDILPLSQIIDDEFNACIYVPTWLAEKKKIQVAEKIYWK